MAPGVTDRKYQFDNAEYEAFPNAQATNFLAPNATVTAELLLATLDGRANVGPQVLLRADYFNDDEASLHAVGRFVAGLRNRRLHLLPYHQLGSEKHQRLGQADPMADHRSPDPASIDRAAKLLAGYGLDVHRGG